MRGRQQQAVRRLQETPSSPDTLSRRDFDLTNGTANERSLVASFEADVPIRIRENVAARLLFTTVEEFTTDGTASNTETFSLSHDVTDTPSGTSFVLYENGNRVAADSVDYANDAFDYTDDGTGNTLTAVYVARDPGRFTIERVAPKAKGQISDELFGENVSTVAETDQNKDPFTFAFMDALGGVIPKNWQVNVYVDAPAPVEWTDDAEATPQGVTAPQATLSLPVEQYHQAVNVGQAVKASILDFEG